ncbi:hypothetical protein E6P97_01090 [Patescibacteria group bacterium]|nr:MAG: hypothetical protein E6P97_01090 [Patescibacteria group bacterium]
MKYIYSVMYAVAMRFTGLLLWTQENRLSEKFYRKLAFDVVLSSDDMSVVKLGDLEVQLANIREGEEFARDMMSGDKGRGTYVYLRVADVDKEYKRQTGLGLEPYSSPRNWLWVIGNL